VVPCSDHSLILGLMEVPRGKFGGTRFWYEEKWRLEEGFYGIMRENWAAGSVGEGNDWDNFTSKLNLCRQGLMRWQRSKREPMQKAIESLKKRLTKIQNSEDRGNAAEIQAGQKELQNLLDREDMQWRQRAKSDWLRDGDRNTRYFHECANARRKTNRIHTILDADERQCDTEDEVQMGFINYFSSLFTTVFFFFFESLFTTVDAGDMGHCLQHMERRVLDDMNRKLLKPFSEDDIRTALFQMAPFKAPGLDGFPTRFYQANWNTVGSELYRAILENEYFTFFMNMTNIVLIPKVKNPTRVTEFRSVSLCNVTYKIISKVLANRLKRILPHFISPIQSAFTPERLIMDNVLVAYETLHIMHSRITGKKGYMANKLDMSKAYDWVE
jgi:hypothetical protein